jgi:hypothetical protein
MNITKFAPKKVSLFFLISMVLFSLSSCNMYDKDKVGGEAYDASLKFHDKVNSKLFKSIYAESDQRLRESISEDDFVAKLNNIHKTCGKADFHYVSKYEAATTLEKIFPSIKKTRTIESIAECENGGQLKSFFNWYINGKERKLISYEAEFISKP